MALSAPLNAMGMGGPVGAFNNAHAQPISEAADYGKRLNTYIYDYFVRNQHYECARIMLQSQESLPLQLHTKSSPNQRQTNGVDDMDMDTKNVDRPKDLPLPDLPAGNGDFLEDWWFQFWDVYHSRRSGQGKPSTITYLSYQRQLQKQRNNTAGGDARNFSMVNGGPGADLKKAAMMNNGAINQTQMQALARARAAQNGNMAANQMERQGSNMDGSPGSGGAPSPKRARVEGNIQQQMAQQRPGAGQMPNQSLEHYGAQMQQQMKHALQAQVGSNMIKGMPNANAAAAAALQGAQGSPMPQPGMMDMNEMTNGMRQNIMQQGVNMAQGQGGANNNGSHALQDYQMQLMLLEQQNKRRLMMARGEQDNVIGHTGIPAPNGQFAPNMSPSGRGGPSPNPNDMARGTPKMNNGPSPNALAGRGSPGPGFDPNVMNANMRNQLMMGPNGQMIPRSSPMSQGQMDMLRSVHQGGMMPNGGFPGAMPPNMMPGQAGVAPNMTPRQNNQMPPPPAPQPNATGTQPSSPAPAAPPTPNQNAKTKAGKKADAKGAKNSNKKNANATAATPASEAEQPPTPTPQTPLTATKNFQQNQNAAMANGMANGAVNGGQGIQPGVMQPGQQEMGVPPFGMDESGQFMISDFTTMNNAHGDVLDNFDFDAFLQDTGDDGAMGAFADYDFPVGGLEADGLGQ